MNAAVTVVIPNYNGETLLAKYVPSILKAFRDGDELVVVDDASSDQSVKWLTKTFHLAESSSEFTYQLLAGKWQSGSKKGKVQVAVQRQNQRYAAASNLGVMLASHRYIFLLNSDVELFPNTISTLLKKFQSEDVFGVGCYELEPQADGQKIEGGKNQLAFRRGRFIHARASNFESGPTAWVSGGSGMFDREKWLKLGGYDLTFRPAYWEDLDLSYRAKKRGWQVLFAADAKVYHQHESTNITALGAQKMAQIGWQHADTFLDKHATLFQRILNILWLPYWWLKASSHYFFQWGLVAIVLIAALLRLNQLGEVPHGMTWDEAAIGYNGYAVLTTRRDEWLTKLPVSFRSFGDYKAPLAIYLNGPFTYFLGMKLWAVRLPFALAGIASVWVIGALVKLFIEWRDEEHAFNHWPAAELLGWLSAGFLALSAWHLHFSRAGFESGLSLFFLLVGVLFLVKALKPVSRDHGQIVVVAVQMVIAACNLAASIYAYHSAKIVTPLVVLSLLVLILSQQKWRQWKVAGMTLLLVVGCCLPLVQDTLWGNGGARFTQASVIGQGSGVQTLSRIASNFAQHLSPAFLIGGFTPTLRHGDGHWGILYATEFVAMLLGVIVIGKPTHQNSRSRCLAVFGACWFVAGLLPAAIGVDVPHPNRALLALPGALLLAALGLEWVWYQSKNFPPAIQWLGSKKETHLLSKSLIGTFILVHSLLFFAYQKDYYTNFAANSAEAFSDGYLEAFRIADSYESQVDQILFTNTYGQSYIYALFVRRTNPIWYQSGSLNKYLFVDTIHASDRNRNNTLIIATPEQVAAQPGDKIIYGSDGKTRFVVIFPRRQQ